MQKKKASPSAPSGSPRPDPDNPTRRLNPVSGFLRAHQSIAIAPASMDDVPLESNKLGFLTHVAICSYVHRGAVFVAALNGQKCGYVISARPKRYEPHRVVHTITQVCISPIARRRGVAGALIASIETTARAAGHPALSCRVAATLPAIHFWDAQHFQLIHRGERTNARRRRVTTWRKFLTRAVPFWCIDWRCNNEQQFLNRKRILNQKELDKSHEAL
jgi:GNAT superfamily N-acetyltransferase